MARVGSILALLLLCWNSISYSARIFSLDSTNLVAPVELVAPEVLNHQLRPTGLIWMAESICLSHRQEVMEVVEER